MVREKASEATTPGEELKPELRIASSGRGALHDRAISKQASERQLARRSQGKGADCAFWESAMSICGVITTKDVLRHGATIVREFGAAAYFRCCAAILMRRRTTFLNCVFYRY